jgi:hypothetical protein
LFLWFLRWSKMAPEAVEERGEAGDAGREQDASGRQDPASQNP